VLFLGLPPAYESEGYDRTHMDLPPHQIELLHAVADANPRLVVVLSNGSAVTMDPWHDRVDAIVEAWLPGQAGAGAVVDVLLGRVNPSGKVAETFPLALEDTPSYVTWSGERGTVVYGEGVFIGYRWYDALRRAVRYPFGHGLSYTTFEYTDLAVTDDVRVSCTVTNTGARAGSEVVQLYVGDPDAAVRRPVRELRGFEKVTLEPGDSTRVTFELSARDFAYWDIVAGAWRREGGEFVLEVGASSRDIRLRTSIELPDDPAVPPLVPDEKLLDRP
jgi:beta-glucosidase